MSTSSMIPLRHRLMMLVGNQLQEAGAMRAAIYQLRMAHRLNIHSHMAAAAASATAARSPYSSSATAGGATARASTTATTTSSNESRVPGVGNTSGGVPAYDWSWQSSTWCLPYRNVSSCWTPWRGWHRWACSGAGGRHNYYSGRYDGDWCSPHRWGRHRHREMTPEQIQQWEQFQKQIWSKAEEWSKWAARWGEEVARATQRTAAEWSAASTRGGPSSSSSWTSTRSYGDGEVRTLTIQMREQPSQYLVEVATPGLPRDHIKISLTDGRLTIATRPLQANNTTNTANSSSGSAVSNTASSTDATSSTTDSASNDAVDSIGHIDLPFDVNTSSISAHYANGMLTMSLPKRVTPTTDIPIQ